MSHIEQGKKDSGLDVAKRMAEEEEGISRRPKGASKYVIPVIGVIWCFFQLSIASWLILDTVFIRAIHLGFALLIVFLNYPLFKETPFRAQVSIRQKQNSSLGLYRGDCRVPCSPLYCH